MSDRNLVLFCGGSKDGHWVSIPDGLETIEVAVPSQFDWNSKDKVEVEDRREQYRIWRITILGYHMRVAALANRNYESDDVIRAIVRRDVALHLTNRRATRG